MPRLGADRRALAGAAVLAAIAGIVVLAWKRPDPFDHARTVRALFADASGLAPIGADVRMAGTPVGKVAGVARDGDYALVTMHIDPAIAVHADASAALRPRLAFEGTAFVDLSAGSPAAPPLGARMIGLAHTRTAVSLSDAMRVLGPASRAPLHTTASTLRAALAGPTAEGAGADVAATPALLRAVAPAARAVRGPHARELRDAVAALARTTDAIDSERAALDPLLRDSSTTAEAVATSGAAPLDASLASLPGTVADVESGAGAASATLARLDPTVRLLIPAARRLAPTLDRVRPLMRSATAAAERVRPLVADAVSALASASAASPPALAALESIAPTAQTLDRSLLPAASQRTTLGTPAYLAFLGLFAGGGGASRPFTPSAGHFMRFGLRFLTGVGQPLPPCTLLAAVNPALATAVERYRGCAP